MTSKHINVTRVHFGTKNSFTGFSDFFSVVQKVVGYYSWALSVKKS